MTTMLERMAKATCCPDGCTMPDQCSVPNAREMKRARAALTALLDPTPAMIEATGLRPGAVVEPFRAMIQAALNEEK